MVVKWDGEAPPDRSAWHEVLSEALGEDAGFHWVRFYKEPEGWRFDLQRRTASGTERVLERADESVALNVYTLLVENGMPLDPGWRPSAPSPPAPRVRRPAPVVAPVNAARRAARVALPSEQVALPAEPVPLPVEPARPPAEPAPPAEPVALAAEPATLAAEPATLAAEPVVLPDTLPGAEAAPAPQSEDRAAEGPPTSGRRRRGRHRRRRAPALPEPVPETMAESVGATLFDAALAPQPQPLTESQPEPEPALAPAPAPAPAPALRPTGWRAHRPAIIASSAVLLVATAVWLSRDRFLPGAAPPAAPSPSAASSQEAVEAQNRPAELEPVASQPTGARPAPPPTPPARIDPVERRTGRTLPPVPTPNPRPTRAPTPAPTVASTPAPTPTPTRLLPSRPRLPNCPHRRTPSCRPLPFPSLRPRPFRRRRRFSAARWWNGTTRTSRARCP